MGERAKIKALRQKWRLLVSNERDDAVRRQVVTRLLNAGAIKQAEAKRMLGPARVERYPEDCGDLYPADPGGNA